MCSFDVSVCLSVCVCVCSRPVNQTSLKRALNANSSKTVKATDLKFDIHVSRVSPDMTPLKFFQKGAWPGSRDPLNFWALNANSSKTVKGTDFKLHTCSQGQSGHDALKFFPKGAWPGSRDPLNFWAINANSSKRLKIRTSNLTHCSLFFEKGCG